MFYVCNVFEGRDTSRLEILCVTLVHLSLTKKLRERRISCSGLKQTYIWIVRCYMFMSVVKIFISSRLTPSPITAELVPVHLGSYEAENVACIAPPDKQFLLALRVLCALLTIVYADPWRTNSSRITIERGAWLLRDKRKCLILEVVFGGAPTFSPLQF